MTPDEILRPLLQWYPSLPDTVEQLLRLLIQKEIETNFRCLQYTDDAGYDPGLELAISLNHILSKLPPIKDVQQGKLNSTIEQLVNLTDQDKRVVEKRSLQREVMTFYEQRGTIKRGIAELEQWIGSRSKGESVGSARSELRSMKESLKSVGEPDVTPYLSLIWTRFLSFRVSFEIPRKVRPQHTFVCGASGTGKTTLLQQLIVNDIQSDASVIVMTLKGAMIPSLARLQAIAPERLIHLSPDNPVPLNLFNLGTRSSSAVELLHHIFDDAKAEATFTQVPLLDNCISFLMQVEGAHLGTLYELLSSARVPASLQLPLERMSPTQQMFFNKQFPSSEYTKTKAQLRVRLDLLLKSPYIEKMFCQPETELDIGKVFDEGKVLLIDTSTAEHGEGGSSFIGRLMLSIITIAAQRRKDTKRPVYFYIDEAGTYMSPKITTILQRCREANVGLTLAVQQLDDLGALESQVLNNTATKFIGRNETHYNKLAESMRVEPEAILHAPDLLFYIKTQGDGFANRTLGINVNPAYIDTLPTRDQPEPSITVQTVHTVRQSGNVQNEDSDDENAVVS